MDVNELNPDCGRIRSELAAHLYDELAPEARAAVDEHLARCGACRDEIAALRETRALLARWETPAMGEDAHALAREIAAQARIEARPPHATPRARLVRWSAMLSGAAAALLFVLGVLNTTVRSAGGRLEIGFSLPGARTADAELTLDPALEERVRTIAAREVATRAASLEQDQEELFQRCTQMTQEEFRRFAQTVDLALSRNREVYDAQLATLVDQAARADRQLGRVINEQGEALDSLYRVLPVSNENTNR